MRRVVLMSALVAIVMIGLTPLATGQAQPPQGKPAAGAASQIEGRWAGTIDTPEGTVPSVAELKLDGGVIKGSLTAGPYNVVIVGGSVESDAVTMTMDVNGMAGTMKGTMKEGVLAGTWVVEGETGSFSLKKGAADAAPAATAAAGAPKPAAGGATAGGAPVAGAEALAGDWDGLADGGEQQVAFSLTFKVEGEKVTGTVSSATQGGGPFEGTFKNNVVTFTFPMPSGVTMTMTATLAEGKLTGTFDMGGQFQAGWPATKKK